MFLKCQYLLLTTLLLVLCNSNVNGDCEVSSQSYSTIDGLVIANVAHIITFNAKCPGKNDLILFADVNGKALPVVRSLDGKTFQISWTVELSKSSSALYTIPIYDEEGFSQLRKAQRAGEASNVKPLFELSLKHSGTYKGPWIQTELVATFAAVLLWWFAYSAKNKLTS